MLNSKKQNEMSFYAASIRYSVLYFFILFSLSSMLLFQCFAQESQSSSDESLKELLLTDIDELGDIPVYIYSASKKEDKLWGTPAAAYVISSTEIRRSGITTIPDLLRMVPGFLVSNMNANTWTIGSRGYTWLLTRDLLVMIDGRSVYSPVLSGTFWNAQDYILEDIEQIEVIRGPGATLWGSNAVNGVINIITKHAKETQGGFLNILGGTNEIGGGVRYGGAINKDLYYRVYGKYRDVDEFKDELGNDAHDDWNMEQAGFRFDWNPTDDDAFMFQVNALNGLNHNSTTRPVIGPPYRIDYHGVSVNQEAVSFLLNWDKSLQDDSDLKLQIYYDYFAYDFDIMFGFESHIFDLDGQYRFSPFPHHDAIIGINYRVLFDDYTNKFIEFHPKPDTPQLISTFLQDTINICEDIDFTIGAKLEHNDYTGFEFQPSARLAYTPNQNYTTWASVSRAVRIPSRSEEGAYYGILCFENPYDPALPPIYFFGSDYPMKKSENFQSFEIGQRIRLNERFSFDLTAFYKNDNDLWTADTLDPVLRAGPPPYYELQYTYSNSMDGETYGVEFVIDSKVTDYWRLLASYAALDLEWHMAPGGFLLGDDDGRETNFPHNQIKFHSYLDLPWDLELDASLYFVDNRQDIPAYTRFDMRLGWKPTQNLEMSIAAHNILDDRHREELSAYWHFASEVPRGVYGKLTYRF